VLLAAAAGLGAGSAHASTGAVLDVGTRTSANWAGYAVDSGDPATGAAPAVFTSVSGSWTQPAVECPRSGTTYSAFWVGLGGFADGSSALEQAGTEADCTVAGSPRYSVWYELVPAAPVTVNLAVQPGDAISTTVSVEGQSVSIQVTDTTAGTVFAQQLPMDAPDLTSAEWIAESPSLCSALGCTPLPLTNFGRIGFGGVSATGNGHAGTILDTAWAATALSLHGAGGAGPVPVADAIPAALASDGSSFAVTWQQRQTPAAAPRPTRAPGRGRAWRRGGGV
jgi:hypothetical protein